MKTNHALKHLFWALGISLIAICCFTVGNQAHAMPQMKPVFDLSNYQGSFNDNEAQGLKNETSFEILNAQQGTYQNPVFANNASELTKFGVPFGIYSYSTYSNVAQAQAEAQSLYNQDPNAKFYVNDLEGKGYYPSSDATIAWAQKMHSLTNRPIILYGNLDYLNNHVSNASKNSYDTIWLAAYTGTNHPDYQYEPNPSYHYDLWQYSDSYPSTSLGEGVDASTIPDQGKPLSYWIGDDNSNNSNSDNQNNDSNQQAKQKQQDAAQQAQRQAEQEQRAKQRAATKQARKVAKRKAQRAAAKRARRAARKAAKRAAAKKAARIKAAQQKAYLRAHYYSSKTIKHVKVTAKKGINVYYHGKKVNHFKRGVILNVKYFKRMKTMTKSINSYGGTFTSNKKLVKAL